MDENFSKIIKTIAFFAMLSLLAGVLKNSIILNLIDDSIKNIVGIASYSSLLVSIMISCIVLGLTAYICFIIVELTNSTINLNELSTAFLNFILVFMIAEIFKVILVFTFLIDELPNLVINSSFKEQFESTLWFNINKITEVSTPIIGVILFGFSFKNIFQKTKLLQILFLCLIVYGCIFLSSIRLI